MDGYIGRSKDFEAVSTDKLYNDYRLDFDNSPFTSTKKTEGYAVYKFENTAPEKVHYAYEYGALEGSPNTQSGFLGNDSRIIPEYRMEKRNFIDGDEMEIYDVDGKLKGTYEYKIDINVNGQIQTGWLKR